MQFLEGLFTAASLEFRQRIRAGKWKWILIGWEVLILTITALMYFGIGDSDYAPVGAQMFGYMMFFALGLLLLVAPSLTAQSINGDRERGTLATLQVTRLSPSEIVLGKLFAAWLTGFVFIVLLIPMALLCLLAGGLPVVNVISSFFVLTLLIGVVCAISLALSSLFNRSTTSTVMSYISVFGMVAISVVVFLLVGSFLKTSREVPQRYYISGDSVPVDDRTYKVTESRYDLIWWMIAPNPVVVLADATPAIPHKDDCDRQTPADGAYRDCQSYSQDALRSLGDGARSLRVDPFKKHYDDNYDYNSRGGAVWPFGLAFDLLLAAGSVVFTTRRLKTPAKTLPRGQRVA